MLRSPLRFALLAAAVAAVASPAHAQFGSGPKAKLDKVRIGFPSANDDRDAGTRPSPVSKVGLWAPVSVAVEYLDVKGYKGGILLEVEARDCDDLRTVTRTPVIPATATEPGTDEFLYERGKTVRKEPTELTHTAYVRLPSDTAEVRLRLVEEGDPERGLSDTVIERPGIRGAAKFVVLSLGANLRGVQFARPDQHTGRVEFAHLDTLEEMPDQWFEYEAADLVVIGTGNAPADFIDKLFNKDTEQAQRKRRALFEWVRRGGKLVVSAGNRAAEVAASAEFAAVLPAAVSPGERVRELNIGPSLAVTAYPTHALTPFTLSYRERVFDKAKLTPPVVAVASGAAAAALPDKLPPDLFPVAALKENPRKAPFTTLIAEKNKPDKPLAVQAPLGLGRVTLVAFDIDRSPFADKPAEAYRADFWEWLLGAAADGSAAKNSNAAANTPLPDNQFNQPPGRRNPRGNATPTVTTSPEEGAMAALRANVDHYDEVPVISFGWVALFILAYTLLIGPVEYVLLKKLLGRLELTWITFPVIVLSVSGAAYLTAYAVKGKDLRMNKIDVVDVDLRAEQPRVYGRTWFTIFSPRIDSYTVGVEPKDAWATPRDAGGYSPVTTVDWFGPAKQGGIGGGSRGYKYEIEPGGDTSPKGNGLSGVPIQVWSTKAFTANWSGAAPPGGPPAVGKIVRDKDGELLTAEITYNLTLKDVQEAYAVYRGKAYTFEKSVLAGVPVKFSPGEQKAHRPVAESPFVKESRFYVTDLAGEDQAAYAPGRKATQAKAASAKNDPLALWGLLFHQKATPVGEAPQNASLRALDQSWRLSEANTDEVMLLFRLRREKDQAEKMMSDADSPSPTRVWLHGLPGRDTKQAVDGIVQQDTYIRMYLPVKLQGGK